MKLRWHRVRPGKYTAGPWLVRRYPLHRAVWELRKNERHVGNFDTVAGAKQWATEQPNGELRQLLSGDQAVPATGQHQRPCSDCPWSRKSLAGWTGSQTPDEWLAEAHGEARIDCHTLAGAQCAGAAIYRANVCKMPRDRALLQLPKDKANVFSTPIEFKGHHDA